MWGLKLGVFKRRKKERKLKKQRARCRFGGGSDCREQVTKIRARIRAAS